MDSGFKLKQENPIKSANCISQLFFGWMIKLCYKCTKNGLQVTDLYRTLNRDKSQPLGDKLQKYWNDELVRAKEKQNVTPSLLRAILKTFFWQYMYYGIILFIQAIVFRSFQPVVLAYLIKEFSEPDSDQNRTKLYIYSAMLIIISIVIVFTNHHATFGQSAVGMRVRIAVSTLIYRKIMNLNNKSLGETAAGQVVNLLSNDVSRFDLVMISLHYLWIMPFQVALVTYFIWQQVGISSLAGVLSMALLTLPIQGYLGKLTSYYRLLVAQRTDTRVKLMSEVISGIQVIKMYAWEKPFEKIIKLARKSEIEVLTKTSYLRGVYLSCMVFIERTTLYLTVICYVLLGNVITADKVFSMAQFFNILQLAMAIFYPMAISYGAETLVSIKRLQEFLVLDEKEKSTVEACVPKEVQIRNLFASWTPKVPVLQNINVHIPAGKLCAIVGPVGSGKSSLLQLLLGELPATSGTVGLGGDVSYSSQEAWLFVASVRKNILFGREYDKNLYKTVVQVCALEKDFLQFPHGDKTIVGERGVSLSGGQRARINLARAVYRNADIYLLDDPLSAVDTHVGKHLFRECIVKYLKSKTRILVTHQLQHLKKADHIIVLNEGKIEAQGTFHELSNTKLDFTKLLVAADETEMEKVDKFDFQIEAERRKDSVLSTFSVLTDTIDATNEINENENEEEMENRGATPLKDYFLATGNVSLLILLLTILILGQTACSGADFWVAYWTDDEALRHSNQTHFTDSVAPTEEIIEVYGLDNKTNKWQETYHYSTHLEQNHTETTVKSDFFDTAYVNGEIHKIFKTNVSIYIYTGLIVAAIAFTLARSFVFFKVAMKSSQKLHSKMFHSLLKAPMRFFDTNPSGRVLNRFSKDMGAVDEILPRVLIEAIQVALVMIGILINVTISCYYMIIAIIILGLIFNKIRVWFIHTAKVIKHLEGITKSPVFSHVSSSLNGITTIRASSAEESLRKQFDEHQDVHTSAWFLTIACIVSFGLWLDIICIIFVAVVTITFIISHQVGAVSGSLVGLAISQSLILTGMLQYGMKQIAEVVNQLTSVERIMQYTKLENEESNEKKETEKALKSWPKKGLVEFRQLYLRYSPTDLPVLKDLNLTIYPGEKIGIVGRTGAGKTSLISALFRLAPCEGKLNIDGIDISTISLKDLRRRISIIPQEPVLFSATLRYNLDPFNLYSDDLLWKALEEVEMKDAADSLDFIVTEGGSNFSVGQRQLLCLARAILRNNKILILDEATANVDPKTDSLIQTTIRKKFKKCTVLTIAHRLNTIMDSDKVLVMESGRMVEFDHPHVLLQDPEGYFTKMVLETGTSMTLQLKDIAHEAFCLRQQIDIT